MKKIFLILNFAPARHWKMTFALAGGFLILNCRAQECNIGNEDTTGYDNLSVPFWSNYLLGCRFYLSTTGTLQSMNLISLTAGAQVQMAVYDDNSGAPGNLISSSNVGGVAQGITTLPVTPLLLNPGYYWVMGIYSGNEYGICNNSTAGNLIYYTSLTFGNPLPLNATGFINYIGADIAYFLEINCLTTGEKLMGKENIKVYPNPASGEIYITAPGKEKQFSITDMYGRLIQQGTTQDNEPVSTEFLSKRNLRN